MRSSTPRTSPPPRRHAVVGARRRLALPLGAALAVALGAPLVGGCVDTTLPDLSEQLGTGPTDGPYCTPEVIDGFPPDTLKIHVIDVGSGDAIWVQTPYTASADLESLDILIDTGSAGSIPGTPPGGATVVDYLLAHGMALGDQIDALIITHGHEDHYGGVPAVTASFDVAAWVDPGFIPPSNGFGGVRAQALGKVDALGGRALSPAVPAVADRLFQPTTLFGPLVDATLLWAADEPPSGNTTNPTGTDINDTSVCLSLSWLGRRVLLMGDAEAEVEEALVAAADAGEVSLEASVLKAGHHGSDTSTTQPFFDRVFSHPDANSWAVISSGTRAYGGVLLPSDAVVERLGAGLERYHVLSTQNRDQGKAGDESQGDDNIIITVDAEGQVQACYAP